MTVRTPPTETLALAFGAMMLGAVVNGYVHDVHVGEQLSAIEVRLTAVEVELRSITCLQVVGVPQPKGCKVTP